MSQLVDTLLERFDIVVLDSPPVLALADAAVISRQAGGVLLVVDLKRSHRRAMRRAVQALRSLDAPLLGLVHNRAKLQDGGYGYYTAAPAERQRSRLAT
jgi:Mrp family chromosome partitioning ATPase